MTVEKNNKVNLYLGMLRKTESAFTLTEVVAAMGLAVIGAITIVGVLAQGLTNSQKIANKTQGVLIAERIHADMKVPGKLKDLSKGTVFDKCYSLSGSELSDPLENFPKFKMVIYFNDNLELVDDNGKRVHENSEKVSSNDEDNIIEGISFRAEVHGYALKKKSGEDVNENFSQVVIKVNQQSLNDQLLNNNIKRGIVPYFFIMKRPRERNVYEDK